MRSITRRAALAVASAALVVPLLAACGSNGGVGGNNAAPQQTGGKITLSYWTWYPDAKTLQPALDAFHAANPNITVKLRVFASQDLQKQLPLALNGGESIDVANYQVDAMTNTVKGKLLPVSEWAKDLPGDYKKALSSKILDQTASAASNGKLYGLPLGGVASPILVYNNDILSKYGISVPKTASDLAAAAATLKAKGIDTPVVETGDGWWQDEVLFGIAGQTDPSLSDSIYTKKASWNQAGIVSALKKYKSLFDSGAISTSVLSLTGSQPDEAFSSGKAAFLIGGSWEADYLSADFRKANNIAMSDVGAVPLPVVDGGSPALRSFAEGGMGIPANSKHVAAAAKFIAYMTYGAGASIWNTNLAYTPAAKVGFTLPSSVLTTSAAKDGLADIEKVAAGPGSKRTAQQDFLNNVEGPTIVDVLRGNITPEAAAVKLQTEWSSGRYPLAG